MPAWRQSGASSFRIQPPEPLFPVRAVVVQFPAGKTKKTIRLSHAAPAKLFGRLLHRSLCFLGCDPSVSGATLSECGLRHLGCLLKRFRELVSSQHLILLPTRLISSVEPNRPA